MKTTPCGLFTFADTDSYNYRDAVNNFERSDKLLAQMGAHSSRFFDYSGVDKIATVGGVVDPRFTATGFRLYGKGEWYYVYIGVTVNADIAKSGSKNVLALPSFYGAMHTQKMRSMGSGRGANGWMSSAGQLNFGSFSGSDTELKAGESLQLGGWYLPANNLTTVGIPTTGEKAPFYSNYIEAMGVIDYACQRVNTKNTVDSSQKSLTISGRDAKDGSTVVFRADINVNLIQVTVQRYGDFAYLSMTGSFKNTTTITPSGDITNKVFGEILSGTSYTPWAYAQPLESDNNGRLIYPNINSAGIVSIAAIGRAGGTGNITLDVGETFSMSGYYRLTGT